MPLSADRAASAGCLPSPGFLRRYSPPSVGRSRSPRLPAGRRLELVRLPRVVAAAPDAAPQLLGRRRPGGRRGRLVVVDARRDAGTRRPMAVQLVGRAGAADSAALHRAAGTRLRLVGGTSPGLDRP